MIRYADLDPKIVAGAVRRVKDYHAWLKAPGRRKLGRSRKGEPVDRFEGETADAYLDRMTDDIRQWALYADAALTSCFGSMTPFKAGQRDRWRSRT